jgi:radical SAM protein with 4Fe4S-binding SPASM domain
MLRFTDNVIGQMTLGCNLNCKYCYEGSAVKGDKKEMSFADFKKALDSWIYQHCVLGDFYNKVIWHFHGGEPLTYDKEKLLECIKYLKRRQRFFPGVTFCIQTNGFLLDDEIVKVFTDEGVSIGVSFDGFNSEERVPREASEKLIEKLRNFREKYGTKFGCLTVLSKSNAKNWYRDMQATQDVFSSYGVNLLCTPPDQKNLMLTADEQWEYWVKPCLESYLTDYALKERWVNMAVENFITFEVLKTKHSYAYKSGCFDRACGHGVNMINIKPDLVIHKCDKYNEEGAFISERESFSIDKRDFLGLQQIREYAKHCKKIFQAENEVGCDLCPYNFLCIGGCQSYSLSTENKISLDTYRCSLYEKTYDFLKLNWMSILERYPVQTLFDIEDINPSYLRELKLYGYEPIIDLTNNTFKVQRIIKR